MYYWKTTVSIIEKKSRNTPGVNNNGEPSIDWTESILGVQSSLYDIVMFMYKIKSIITIIIISYY